MLKKKDNKLLKSKKLCERRLTKPTLELLKLRKLKKLPRMLLETPRKMLLPGNRGQRAQDAKEKAAKEMAEDEEEAKQRESTW